MIQKQFSTAELMMLDIITYRNRKGVGQKAMTELAQQYQKALKQVLAASLSISVEPPVVSS